VGKHLTALLIDSGYSVSILSQYKEKRSTEYLFFIIRGMLKTMVKTSSSQQVFVHQRVRILLASGG
jgi:hypothetical protein